MLALRNGHKNIAIDLINAGAKFDEKSRDVCNLHGDHDNIVKNNCGYHDYIIIAIIIFFYILFLHGFLHVEYESNSTNDCC